MIVWALTDERVGSNNQSIALAEKLSPYYIIKKINYNSFISLPNFIRRASLIGVDKEKSDNLDLDLPDVVVCAGRRLSSVALYIKKKTNGKALVINIMNPNLPFKYFDILILPKHDNTSKFLLKDNIIQTNGSLSIINKEKTKNESNKWSPFFKEYKKPLVALMIGGDTKDYKFDPQEFGIMISNLSNIVNKLSGSLLITTSRRTSDECVKEIKRKLNCDYYFYDWKIENNANNTQKSELGNPYSALLGLSNFLVVTGDSMSMVSEACSTGKPTYVYMPKKSLGKKHMRFLQALIKDNYIKEFNKDTTSLENYSYEPLDELNRVVKIVEKKLKEKK